MALLKDAEVAFQLCQGGVYEVLPALIDVLLHHQGRLNITVSDQDLKIPSNVEETNLHISSLI